MKPLTTEECRVLAALRSGNKRTLELAVYMDVRDKRRAVREAVSGLQRAGYCVVNMQDGMGYRLLEPTAENMPAIKRYVAQERSRGIAALAKLKAMSRAVKDWEKGQA